MKVVITCILLLTLISCHKRRNTPFTEKELDFVSYTPDLKQIKFVDSSGFINTLSQTNYDRSFTVLSGFFTLNEFYETYTVYYNSLDTLAQKRNQVLDINMDGASPFTPARLILYFYNYSAVFNPDSLHKEILTLSINNKDYSNVYKLKMDYDSTFIYYNRQYGIIQMVYKNGKTVTRVE